MKVFATQLVGGVAVIALLFLVPACGAASPAPEAAAAPYQPPTFSYGDGTIDVVEAVRLTLEHDPNLLLKQQDVEQQRGVLEELTGAFDWTLSGQLSYQHKEQELRQSVIDQETKKRQDLRDANSEACQGQQDSEQTVGDLEHALNVPSGAPVHDPSIDTQLQLIEKLIAQEGDPSRRQELVDLRHNFLLKELTAARNEAQDYQIVCDQTAQQLARIGDVPQFEEFNNGKLQLKLDKLFRTGVKFSPFLDGSYDHTEYVGKRQGYFQEIKDANGNVLTSPSGLPLLQFIDFGGKNVPDLYSTQVGFDVNFPLLRGRGRASTGAPEQAAGIDLDATALTFKHAAAVSVLQTLQSYWNLLASQHRVDILKTSVDLQQKMVSITDTLIQADEMPRAGMSRVQASAASAKAQLENAREALAAARLALAKTMGVNVEGLDNAPLAAGPFPAAPATGALTVLVPQDLVSEAVAKRFDVRAYKSLVKSGLVLAHAAELDLKAKLDLSGSVYATARGEDSYSNAVDRWRLPSWSLALALEKPIANNQRLGILKQRKAQLAQRQIRSADLERTVGIGVVQSLETLKNAVDQLASTQESADHYEETIKDELEKLRYGQATLVDSILTEQQRTGALLALVAAQQQVANLVAQLRFESGTLVTQAEGEAATVSLDSLTTVPAEAER